MATDRQHQKTKIMTFQKSDIFTPPLYYKNIFGTKEYNFLGNIIHFKGNFKRAAQELSKNLYCQKQN